MRAVAATLAVAALLGMGSTTRAAGGAPRQGQADGRSRPASEDRAEGFGYKCGWVAIRGRSAREIAIALGLEGLREVAWHEGLALAYEVARPSAESRWIFVTPDLDGWTLAVSWGLLGPLDTDPDFVALVTELSRKLHTEVQYFATYRVPEGHGWALARDGELVRAYATIQGEVRVERGPTTVAEQKLGFAFFDARSPDAKRPGYWDRTDLRFVRETDVVRLARAWSVDPTSLGGRPVARGFVAEYRR